MSLATHALFPAGRFWATITLATQTGNPGDAVLGEVAGHRLDRFPPVREFHGHTQMHGIR
ncbi:hypothetical protein FMUBM48_19270 [Nocardia cyriacigeorgica]|nr:hypothetical protein FMUBM48_19270 [Nocardia cyriacigeorgica]